MSGSIICGVDGSESAKGAARVARALSGELGLDVVFVHAVDRDAADEVDPIAEQFEFPSDGAEPRGAAWSVEAGHPADALVAAARQVQATMIVVGSTGPRSSLLGSISADVSRRAPCPVVVVPPGAEESVGSVKSSAGDLTAGIGQFGIGEDAAEVAGGVVRLGLDPGERAA